jgi:hypothetical protein
MGRTIAPAQVTRPHRMTVIPSAGAELIESGDVGVVERELGRRHVSPRGG